MVDIALDLGVTARTLTTMVDALEKLTGERTDLLTVMESRLFDQRVRAEFAFTGPQRLHELAVAVGGHGIVRLPAVGGDHELGHDVAGAMADAGRVVAVGARSERHSVAAVSALAVAQPTTSTAPSSVSGP